MVKINLQFTFKAMLAQEPVTTLACASAISSLILAFLLHLFERGKCLPFNGDGGDLANLQHSECMLDDQYAFRDFRNCYWNTLITMTTVGYGDIYPVTEAGRVVAVIAAVWGVVLISLFVTVIQDSTKLSAPQWKLTRILASDEEKYRTLHLAAVVLQKRWRCHNYSKKHAIPWGLDRAYCVAMDEFRQHRTYMKFKRLYEHCHSQDDKPADIAAKIREEVNIEVKQRLSHLEGKMESILKLLRPREPHSIHAEPVALTDVN